MAEQSCGASSLRIGSKQSSALIIELLCLWLDALLSAEILHG